MSHSTVSLGIRGSLFGAVGVVVFGALLACSSVDQPKPPPAPLNIEQPGRHLITVTERQTGAHIVLDAAQELVVRLPLEAFAVTADLDWVLVDVKPEVLASGASRFEVGPRDTDAQELGGNVVWRLTPQAAGTTTLRFELRRTHSLDPATRIATYVVRVK
jgi:hypothetical protein